jgi:pyruvate dehydrogenase E1 component alpha subunit
MRVPLIFLLINNQYAISTPTHKQTAATSLAIRAEGYGFPGVAVDGNDLLAVFAVTAEAVHRALAGRGPTLIELKTYRIGFHNTSDNPNEYRQEDEVVAAALRDPIERARRFATRAGIWCAEMEAATLRDVHDQIEAAQRVAEGYPRPGPAAVFDHVYASPPRRLDLQRAEVLKETTPHLTDPH